MDALNIFKKLGTGAKFDFKKYNSDARKLQILNQREVTESVRSCHKNTEKHGSAFEEGEGSDDAYEDNSFDESDGEICDTERDEKNEVQLMRDMGSIDNGDKTTGSKSAQKRAAHKLRKKQISKFRREYKIYVSGQAPPEPMETFEQMQNAFDMNQTLIQNIATSGYTRPTPIQMQAMPTMIKGRNMMACAPTGSGKTATFLIPLLHQLKEHKSGGFRALILAPVRELAQQIQRECERLGEGLGIRAYSPQSLIGHKPAQKRDRYDIFITTPMVLLGLLEQKSNPISLSNVEWLVVDECDKLFEESGRGVCFREQLGRIYRECVHPKLKRALFSATYAQDVEHWCKKTFENVLQIYIGEKNTATDTVEQELVFTGNEDGKLYAIKDILKKPLKPPVLVFVQSKGRAEQLYQEVAYEGVSVGAIHADKSKDERDEAIKRFRCGDLWVLICTQLMGRGIDFVGVNLVINYDFPLSTISYIHSIEIQDFLMYVYAGRTGRAGRKGRAITFYTTNDMPYLRSVADVMKEAGCPLPEFLLTMEKPTSNMKKQLKRKAPKRKHISTVPKHLQPELKKKQKKKRKIQQGEETVPRKKQKFTDPQANALKKTKDQSGVQKKQMKWNKKDNNNQNNKKSDKSKHFKRKQPFKTKG